MTLYVLPDAQEDLLALQNYMLQTWDAASWVVAESEIYDKLALVESGVLKGAVVQELAAVGIVDYLCVLTSHHRLIYRVIGHDFYVYIVAGQQQDFPTLLLNRLLRR